MINVGSVQSTEAGVEGLNCILLVLQVSGNFYFISCTFNVSFGPLFYVKHKTCSPFFMFFWLYVFYDFV